jgi:hypothetical protein
VRDGRQSNQARECDVPGLGPAYRLSVEDAPAEADVEVLPHARRPTMKAAGRAFLTGHPKPSARFLPLAPAAENGIFKEHLVRGRGQMGRRSSLLFDNYLGIGEQVRRAVNPSAAAARGYSYLAPGPIDEPNWAFAVDGDEFPLTVIS